MRQNLHVPRIALLFEFATLNGGERSMLAALDWLNQDKTRFEFVAIGPPVGRLANALREREIPLVGWSTRDVNGQRLSVEQIQSSLGEIIDSLRPQLLHANSLSMGRLTGRCFAGVEMPTTAHLRDIIKLSSAAVADLNRNHKLVAVSAATRQFHVAQGIDERLVKVVRNGIDLHQFQPRPRSGQLFEELVRSHNKNVEWSSVRLPLVSSQPVSLIRVEDTGDPKAAANSTRTLSHDNALGVNRHSGVPDLFDDATRPTPTDNRPYLIATIGQIGLRKGQDVLAAAAPVVIERFPHAHFLLIGERTSQKEESIAFEQAIHQTFAGAGLSDHLHFLGHREDVPFLLNEVDLLVHPAQQEPFGRVLLEASAAAVPIIATNVGGTSEIVFDGVTGLLVPPRDPRALAQATIRLLSDRTEALRLGAAARVRAANEFSIAVAARNLAEVWDELL